MMQYDRLKDSTMELGSRQYVKYMIRRVQIGDQKNGGRYMSLVIGDNETEYSNVKIFGVNDNMIERIVAGKVYKGAIDVKEYMGQKSLVVYNIESCDEDSVSDYIAYEYDYEKHLNNLKNEIEDIGKSNSELKLIVEHMIKMTNNKFWNHTAGVSMHHRRLGGLVVHTDEVLEISKGIVNSGNYSKLVNYDMLRTACILHDVGKCAELVVDGSAGTTEYGVKGLLEGHITIGVEMLNAVYNNLIAEGININPEYLRNIRHCILSHHGKLEYGSPVTPSTIEAKILSYADLISCDIYKMREEFNLIDCGEISSKWVSNGYINVYKSKDYNNNK